MIPTGDDDQITVVHAIDQPVTFIDPPGPETGQVLPEGFGLADPLKGLAKAIPDQCIDPLEGLFVLTLPVESFQASLVHVILTTDSLIAGQSVLFDLAMAILSHGCRQMGGIGRRAQQMHGFHETVEGIHGHQNRPAGIPPSDKGIIGIVYHLVDDGLEPVSGFGKIDHAHGFPPTHSRVVLFIVHL